MEIGAEPSWGQAIGRSLILPNLAPLMNRDDDYDNKPATNRGEEITISETDRKPQIGVSRETKAAQIETIAKAAKVWNR